MLFQGLRSLLPAWEALKGRKLPNSPLGLTQFLVCGSGLDKVH